MNALLDDLLVRAHRNLVMIGYLITVFLVFLVSFIGVGVSIIGLFWALVFVVAGPGYQLPGRP
jgi:hypothetical protein